jgi:hypothetical protein
LPYLQLTTSTTFTTSTSDIHGSDETNSANGSGSRQSKNVSSRSGSSGYGSAHNPSTNRGLREELGLSELELEEERIKSQQSKAKGTDRLDSISVGVTESSLRDLLSNPEPLIPLQYNSNSKSIEPPSCSMVDSHSSMDNCRSSNDVGHCCNDTHRPHSRSTIHASSTTTSVASSKSPKGDTKKKDEIEHNDTVFCDESQLRCGQGPSQIVLSSGSGETDSKMADSNSNSAFNFKKDLKQRFSNEGEEHGQACPNHAHKFSTTMSHQHTRNSRLRGHNSKDSKDKIMEGFIKMKRKQDQDDQDDQDQYDQIRKGLQGSFPLSQEKTEEDGNSSPTSPTPPESSSICSEKPAQSPLGIPCFALHPSGTFYVPIAIHPNLIQSTLEKKLGSQSSCPTLCHPVSIPVNFMSTDNPTPNFSLHNINVGVAPIP